MSITTTHRRNKHLVLNQARLDQAKKILGAATETETVDIALKRVITEAETNKKLWAAHDRFIKSAFAADVEIEDVFRNLKEK